MDITLLTERYGSQIAGVLNCWDRVLIFGTLPKICFAAGMTSYLNERRVRIFDNPRFAERYRNELRENAERLAAEAGLEIEFIRKRNFRKEDRIKEVLTRRGERAGLVHVFSAMEPCSTYKPWHDKATGRTFLKPDDGKCLHCYFYFLDEELGLSYVRVPTWLPCRLQIYFNGHNRLAMKLRQRKIGCTLMDNAFASISDWTKAQSIADSLRIQKLHRKLDELATRFCPIYRSLGMSYHWSVDQCEYATCRNRSPPSAAARCAPSRASATIAPAAASPAESTAGRTRHTWRQTTATYGPESRPSWPAPPAADGRTSPSAPATNN